MRTLTQFFLLLGLLTGLAARAQGLDPSFVPTVLTGGITAGVEALAVQPDGKALVAGEFAFVNGTLTNEVLRLNANGSRDGSFLLTGGANGRVDALALQSDGKILIGGGFSTYGGVVTGPLARLNPDGTLDAAFSRYASLGINGQVTAIALQADGKILVGGTVLAGAGIGKLVRLYANGTVDSGFNIGYGADGPVQAVLVQPDGKIVVGGSFLGIDGRSMAGLTRLNANGSPDSGFNVSGSGTSRFLPVLSLALQPDGKLLVGGHFTTYNGAAVAQPMRLRADGTPDATFQSTIGPNCLVSKVRLRANGELLVAGYFAAPSGQRFGSVLRLSATGVRDASFGTPGGTGILCNDAVEWTGGQVLVGGNFRTYPLAPTGRAPIAYLARLAPSGLLDTSFNLDVAVRGTLTRAIPLTTGEVLLQGDFNSLNGTAVAAGSLHRLTSTGSYAGAVVPTATGGNVYYVHFFPQPDGRIYAVTLDFGTTPYTYALVRLLATGARDAGFQGPAFTHPTQYNNFYQVLPQANGTVVVAGDFDTVNGTPHYELVRLQATGALDAAFNPAAFWNGQGHLLEVVPEPGGTFLMHWQRTTGPNYLSQLNRLDAAGALLPGFAVNSRFGGTVPLALRSVTVQPDGYVLVSGNFGGFAGALVSTGLVRLTPAGTADPGFVAAASGDVLAVQSDGRLLLKTDPDLPTCRLQRLGNDGSLDASFPAVGLPEVPFSTISWNLSLQPQDGKILLYGSFTTVAGQQRIGLARLNNSLLGTAAATAEAASTVFPNPAHGTASLALPAAPVARPVLLLDATGRVLRRQLLPAQAITAPLDLRGLPAGLYFVRCGGTTQRLAVE